MSNVIQFPIQQTEDNKGNLSIRGATPTGSDYIINTDNPYTYKPPTEVFSYNTDELDTLEEISEIIQCSGIGCIAKVCEIEVVLAKYFS